MTDLIKISAERTVNARELHEFLESKQQFSHWIKNRVRTVRVY
jgi:phage anti-repressor protein